MGGEVRGPGPRSLEALRWLEPLDAVGLEALACAMGFGRRLAYSHVRRLEQSAAVVRVYDREGSVVAVTAAGRRRVRPDRVDGRAVIRGAVRTRAAHARAVSWVAARATLLGRAWVGERDMRRSGAWRIDVLGGERRTHRADLGVLIKGGRVAVEVELTAKAPARLRGILAAYEDRVHAGGLAGVVYVYDEELVARGVRRAAAQVGLREGVFRTVPLARVIADARALAQARGVGVGSQLIGGER